ncbi:MAG TPA: M24 family metallopeptidase, partial [Candidatus Micrarchaeota archaeon]|nr:M24 family metallopeptidase [Candidatus Micrarchaeota archaeon]
DGCMLVLGHDCATIISPWMNFNYALANSHGIETQKYSDKGEFSKLVKSGIGKAKTLLLDYQSTKLSFADFLAKSSKAKRADFSDKISELRSVKSEYEKSCIDRAILEAETLLAYLESNIGEGMSEKKIESMLLCEMIGKGLKPSFSPIVASGANSSSPHSQPTGAKVRGHVLVDMGVKVEGYCSDLTRCFFFPSGRMQKNAYDKLTLICDELCDKAESGAYHTGSELASDAARLLERYNLPKLPHSIGHGVGLDVHESPSLGLKSKDKIVERMVIAIEPAAYYPGKFGVRHEKDVFL